MIWSLKLFIRFTKSSHLYFYENSCPRHFPQFKQFINAQNWTVHNEKFDNKKKRNQKSAMFFHTIRRLHRFNVANIHIRQMHTLKPQYCTTKLSRNFTTSIAISEWINTTPKLNLTRSKNQIWLDNLALSREKRDYVFCSCC